MAKYRADPFNDKVDLGVGVYRDLSGNTPILECVRRAEKEVLAAQTTKSYSGAEHQFLQGTVEFLPAGGADVGFRGLGGQDLFFRPADAFQNGRIARQIPVNAYAQIDLVVERVCSIFRH